MGGLEEVRVKNFQKGDDMAKNKFADGGMPMMPPTAPAARGRPGMGAPAGGRGGIDPKILAALMAARGGAGGRGMPPGAGAAPPARPPMPAQPLKKGGMAKGGFTKAADGVAKKGKTKATQVKMAGGGKC